MKKTSIYLIYFYGIIIVAFLVDIFFPVFPSFRYIRYIGIPLFVLLITSRSVDYKKINERVRPYLFLIIVSLLFLPSLTKQGFLEITFIFAGISMFIFKPRKKINININALNNLAILLFVLFYSWQGKYSFSWVDFLKSDTSSVEGGYSFVYGFFAIYYLGERDYKRFVVNIIFLVLTLKRIVFLGVIVYILLLLIPKRLERFVLNKFLWIGLNIIFILTIHLFVLGNFNDMIKTYTGLSVGQFTGGRSTLYSLVLNNKTFSKIDYFIGKGQGFTTNTLHSYFGHVFLLHNDILKITIEHGYLGLLIFLLLLYNTNNKKVFRISVFLNILYLTDNVLIYQNVYMMYFLITYLYSEQKNELSIT